MEHQDALCAIQHYAVFMQARLAASSLSETDRRDGKLTLCMAAPSPAVV